MKGETAFILKSNPNGFIVQVLYTRDAFDVSGLLQRPLLFCVTPEYIEAAKRFLDDVRWTGKAENHLLEVTTPENTALLSFSGVMLRDHILLEAHQPEDKVNAEEISEITENLVPEEVTASLQSEETPSAPTTEQEEMTAEVTVWKLMEEMSRLNNELINTKRELIRKNVELERLQKMLKKAPDPGSEK